MDFNDKSRSIPSLDGMRAFSILLVIFAHSGSKLFRWIKIPLSTFVLFAHTGVSVFFVISGFLITTLLVKELRETGTIQLRRFYIRRAFRIFPPFYVYLFIIGLIVAVGLIHTRMRAFFFAAIYASNYYSGPGGGFLGLQHIWTLCVEEQFYLLWPPVLLFLGRRRAVYAALIIILISPFSRLVTYLLLTPQHRAGVDRMFHSSIDTIMFGCLLALVWNNDRFNRLLRIWANGWSVGVTALFLFLLDPVLVLLFHGRYSLMVGMTLEGLSICLLTAYLVRQPQSLIGRVLNTRLLRHIGVISYSLYLWQNILTGQAEGFFPLNLLAILICAELSYFAVERPSLRLRDRLWGTSRADRR